MNHRPTAGSPSWWAEGDEPGWRIVAIVTMVILGAAALNTALADRLGLLFDLTFVAMCLGAAMLVRRSDFFLVGVSPPLLLVGAVTIVGLVDRAAVSRAGDGLLQAVVSALATHSAALLAGYGLCLVTLALRQRTS